MNPTETGFDAVYVFRHSSSLVGYDYTWCAANTTQVYTGTNQTYTNTGLTVTGIYYYKVFTKFGASYSNGVHVITEKSVFVDDYWVGGDANWSAAIGRAHTALSALGGGTLVFSNYNYLVNTGMGIISDVKWRGVTGAKLYTQKTSLYQYLVIGYYKSNIVIENIIFDQWGDTPPTYPTSSAYTYCIGLYFYHSNNITI